MPLSNVDRNSLPYLMAYSGIYIAFDGLTKEDASRWSSAGVLSDLEKKTINQYIYDLLLITKNDLNDDGEVCFQDAEELVDLVIKEYNKDCKKKYGSDSNVAIQKFSQFITRVENDKSSPEILDFCYSFLKNLKNVSNNPKSAEKLIKIIEKSWFKD